MSKLSSFLIAIPLVLASAACGAPPARTGVEVCTAVEQLAGNRGDFQAFIDAETADAALAALDRMSERTGWTVDALEGMTGPAAPEARRLAQVERELLPILDQFRDVQDQAGWTAARDAYARWYDRSVATITTVVPRLGDLGIHCA